MGLPIEADGGGMLEALERAYRDHAAAVKRATREVAELDERADLTVEERSRLVQAKHFLAVDLARAGRSELNVRVWR